ncbi:ParE family toxin-like protein [Aeromonas salmonicida]
MINVGLRYRLFRPLRTREFQLMTHERYNTAVGRNRR